MWNQQRPELLEIRPLEMKTLEVPCECFILVMTAGADAKRRELRLMGCVCVCVCPPLLSHGGSDGKESACSVGDPGSVPKLGRSPGEGMATHSSILP